MPASLIKMFVTATSSTPTLSNGTVSTNVTPSADRFSALASDGTLTGTTLTILATDFVDDNGDPVIAFPTNDGYYNLYANGILQQEGLSTLTTTEISIIDGDQIPTSAPIMIKLVNASATSSITVEPTVSTPTITVNT